MKNRNYINKKHLLIYTFTLVFFFLILPIFSIKMFPPLLHQDKTPANKVDIPSKVSLFLTKSKKTVSLDFEEYIKGVVASEMPMSFDAEALKAQAIASRTYALGKITAGDQLCDSTHCQVYRSNNISSKVAKAVEATKGEVLYYKDNLAGKTFYFASSGGRTENVEDVFTSPIPYLKSVKSPYESHATHKTEKTILSFNKFLSNIKTALPSCAFGKVTPSKVKIISRSKGNRVKLIKVGSVTMKGTEFRSALGLYSANFAIDISKEKVTITTHGSGHGVGLSQYGADGFARKGYSYDEILKHYYQGTYIFANKKD